MPTADSAKPSRSAGGFEMPREVRATVATGGARRSVRATQPPLAASTRGESAKRRQEAGTSDRPPHNSHQRIRSANLDRLEKQRQSQRRERDQEVGKRNMSDDYLLSNDDEDLYAARMNYLTAKRPSNHSVGRLFSYANSAGPAKRTQRTIVTYNEDTQSPTKDLQTLVLVLAREKIREELAHLGTIVNDQNPLEMRNMRLNSFIANTHDLMDHWKSAMLFESSRIIKECLDHTDLAWVTPSTGAERELPTPLDEQMLVSVPQDKPEISKSQVATEYIQAQRGQQGNDQDDFMQLFQNDMLKAEFAAATTPEVFEKICSCHRLVVQKVVEIEYIEKKPETCQAVSSYIEQLKTSVDRVVQGLLKQDQDEAVALGGIFVRALIGQIMDELHAWHGDKHFEPLRVQISGTKQD